MKSSNDDSSSASVFHAENVFLEVALAAAAAGLSVVPPRMDGSKAPLASWTPYQQSPPDEAQLRRWYSAPCLTGVGIVTGQVSGNLELLEFDDRLTYEAFKSATAAAGLGALVARIEAGYCEVSPKPGVHWLYRCAEIAGNTKLAGRVKTPEEMKHPKDREQVLIETRGEGGYVVVAPSNGKTHPSGGCYSLLSGGFDSIVWITPEERRDLFSLARTFHVAPMATQEPVNQPFAGQHGAVRPGDDFNQKAVWAELLEGQGWTFVYRRGDCDYWRRPGKQQGVSACTGWGGKDYFYCFSTSTEFEAGQPLDKFGFYVQTMHGGDFKAAVKALSDAHYGPPDAPPARDEGYWESVMQEETPAPPKSRVESDSPDLEKPRFVWVQDFCALPAAEEWIVKDYLERDVIGVIYGDSEAFKSFIAIDLCAHVATGRPWRGARVQQGITAFIAGEGGNGLRKRFKAWFQYHNEPLRNVAISTVPLALCDPANVQSLVADTVAFLGAIRPSLIVLDTLNAHFGGGDENSTADMTKFLAGMRALRVATGATVLALHHCGHGAKDRGRGSISLRNGIDWEYRAERQPESLITTLACTKSKDSDRPKPLAWELETVALPWLDTEGHPLSSAILRPLDAVPVKEEPLSSQQRQALDLLKGLYQTAQDHLTASGHDPAGARVAIGDWQDAMKSVIFNKTSRYKIREALLDKGMVRLEGAFVYPTSFGTYAKVCQGMQSIPSIPLVGMPGMPPPIGGHTGIPYRDTRPGYQNPRKNAGIAHQFSSTAVGAAKNPTVNMSTNRQHVDIVDMVKGGLGCQHVNTTLRGVDIVDIPTPDPKAEPLDYSPSCSEEKNASPLAKTLLATLNGTPMLREDLERIANHAHGKAGPALIKSTIDRLLLSGVIGKMNGKLVAMEARP